MKRTKPKGSGGSRKGKPNKITKDLKGMIEGALAQAGGIGYLVKQSKDNPAAFLTLVGKILPKDVQLSGAGGESLEFIVRFAAP